MEKQFINPKLKTQFKVVKDETFSIWQVFEKVGVSFKCEKEKDVDYVVFNIIENYEVICDIIYRIGWAKIHIVETQFETVEILENAETPTV